MKKKTGRTKLMALLLSAAMLLALAACGGGSGEGEPSAQPETEVSEEASAEPQPEPEAETSEEPEEASGPTAGTYTGTAVGYGGEMTVEVTVDETGISAVNVTANSETVGIGTNAVDKMPGRIVEHQSIALDTMTGCTISSAAVLAAAKDALTQAGADIEAFSVAPAADTADVTLEADVVVVGGGMAGLSAAYTAAENGAKVILLEKAAQTGGATATSGGDILAGGSRAQEEQGIEDSVQGLKDYWWMMGEENINEELMHYVADSAPEVVEWFMDMGVNLTLKSATGMPWMDPLRCHRTDEGMNSPTQTGGGVGYTVALTKGLEEMGAEILYETPAQSLIIEDGAVVGVEALTKPGAKVTVKAKNVILATGGYDGNDDMMNEYMPNVIGRSVVGQLHAGDGHRMAEEAGAEMLYHTNACVALALDYGPTSLRALEVEPYGPFLFVLPDGSRFMDESQYMFIRSGNLIKIGSPMYWTIIGSNSGIENLDANVEAGLSMKADSIEELAAAIGADPATLTATVDRYNELCEKGVDEDFGKTNDNMVKMGIEGSNLVPINEGPYYAVQCLTVSISGTVGGPRINMDGQVINTDGDVISGLYAAGEIANDEFYNVYYPSSGTSLTYCAVMGRRAGAHAASN